MSASVFRVLSFLACIASSVAAQAPLTAASFLPPDYEIAVLADLARMRECGIWDELDHSVLSVVLRKMEEQSGMRADDIDRVRVVIVPERRDGDSDEAAEFRILYLCEGRGDLGRSGKHEGWIEERIGSFDCLSSGRELLLWPAQGLRVQGRRELIEPVLTGKPWNGLPHPDLLSLLSGAAKNLAYVVAAVDTPSLRRRINIDLLQEIEWPESDPPTWLMLRLVASGTADDPGLSLQAVLRHREGKKGLSISKESVQERLAEAAKNSLPALRGFWRKVELRADGVDLVAEADLGRARAGVATLAQLLAPVLLTEKAR
ncbi:MAG: hypothetical protein Fur0037_25430 [Planctomycetota bacterium]